MEEQFRQPSMPKLQWLERDKKENSEKNSNSNEVKEEKVFFRPKNLAREKLFPGAKPIVSALIKTQDGIFSTKEKSDFKKDDETCNKNKIKNKKNIEHKSHIKQSDTNISNMIKIILKSVSLYYNISEDKLLEKDQKRKYTVERYVAMYLVRKKTNISFNKIANIFLRKNIRTISDSYKMVDSKIKDDKKFNDEIDNLLNIIDSVNN